MSAKERKKTRKASANPSSVGAGAELPRLDPAVLLGGRIRHARTLSGLTLKHVATEAGCSESMLSKIERGQASPSLSALHRLAKALNTNVAELTAQEEAVRSPVMRAGERPLVSFGNGGSGIQLERLVAPARSQLLQGDIHLLAPGTASEEMIHHVGEEFGYVLEGELELKLGDSHYTLSVGDSFYFASEIPHSYRNPGAVTTRVLWINTPPTF